MNASKPAIRTLLIGLGNIGQHHLRLLKQAQTQGFVQIVGVVDISKPIIEGIATFANLADFWQAVETKQADMPHTAVIATPIPTHFDLVQELLLKQVHVFVEKPITPTYEQALELSQLAQKQNRVLFVGHSERYNPAFQVFLEEFKKGKTGKVYRIECNRTGPYPQRIGDSGATIDLAVHDLDSLCAVMHDEIPNWVFAKLEQRIHPTQDDGLNAMIGYTPDIIAALTVNWLSPSKNRFLNVYGHAGMLKCDFYLQKVTFFENLYQRTSPDQYGIGGIEVGAEISYAVPKWEPLAKEHEHFFALVHQGLCAESLALINRACLAVKLANDLQKSSKLGQVLQTH